MSEVGPSQGLPEGVGEVLAEGEQVVVAVDGLVRESGVIFDKCRVVLTDGRLILLKQGWPWGYKVDRSIPRGQCSIKNHKERFDGSQLVLVNHDAGVLCLYFKNAEAATAVAFRAALGDPSAATA